MNLLRKRYKVNFTPAMPSKRDKLIARSRETTREPAPRRLEADRIKAKGYRIVAVSLYTPEADWIDEATEALRKAGNTKANRSLVVREAVMRLQHEVDVKNPNGLLADFTARQAKRNQKSTS